MCVHISVLINMCHFRLIFNHINASNLRKLGRMKRRREECAVQCGERNRAFQALVFLVCGSALQGILVAVTFFPMVSICRQKSYIKLKKKKVNKSAPKCSTLLCLVHLCQMAYMEADAMEVGVKVVQDPTAIKYEGRLQHLFVNCFIVQFLWWKQILLDDVGVDTHSGNKSVAEFASLLSYAGG